jgi:hypothetical protein
MQHICLRASMISGVAYNAGDAVPYEAVEQARRKRLISMGIISEPFEAKRAEARDAPSDGAAEQPQSGEQITPDASAEPEQPVPGDGAADDESQQPEEEGGLNGVKKPAKGKGR